MSNKIIKNKFFFFFRNQTSSLGLYWKRKQTQWASNKTRGWMSSGRSSNQTRTPNKSLAFLANISATTLHNLLTWLNSHNWKSSARTKMSSMTFPYEDRQPLWEGVDHHQQVALDNHFLKTQILSKLNRFLARQCLHFVHCLGEGNGHGHGSNHSSILFSSYNSDASRIP